MSQVIYSLKNIQECIHRMQIISEMIVMTSVSTYPGIQDDLKLQDEHLWSGHLGSQYAIVNTNG